MISSNTILGGLYGYLGLLYLLAVIAQVWASMRLQKRAYELREFETELSKTEKWLDNREIKLEKKLDKLRAQGITFRL